MLRKINISMQLSLQIKVIYLQGSPKKKKLKPREQNASVWNSLEKVQTLA